MEVERGHLSSVCRSWWTGSGGSLARRILMPWTCRRDRPSSVQRRRGSSGALVKRRHQVHPSDVGDDNVARPVPVRGRRVWKNLFPVNGPSVSSLSNKLEKNALIMLDCILTI